MIPSHRVNRYWPIDLEHITAALILKTDVKAGGRKEFVYSHINGCGSIAVAIQESGIFVYILIWKIGRLVVANVDGRRPLSQMIVAISGIGEQGISGDIALTSCLTGASPVIGLSAAAEDIVESNDRRILITEGLTVETGLRWFCDYYVIGQFRLDAESIGKDAGTDEGGVVVGNRVIDECRSLREVGYPVKTCAEFGLIAGDEILNDQSLQPI